MNKNNALSTYLSGDSVKKSIQEAVGKRSQQFVTSMLAVVNSNEALQKCERKSILSACLTAAALDLPINSNLGFAYIIPYKVKVVTHDEKGKEITTWEDRAQFQMGYKGFIQLAQRSNQLKTINARDVREGELIEEDYLSGELTFEKKENRESLPVIGYVAFIRLNNGFEKSLYMTVEELKSHGVKYSKSAKKGYGLWVDEFDSMARKTITKLLLAKYAPLTTDSPLARAIEVDQAIIKEDGDVEYPDNEPATPEEIAAEKERNRIIKHINDSTTLKQLEICDEAIQDQELREMYNAKRDQLAKESK